MFSCQRSSCRGGGTPPLSFGGRHAAERVRFFMSTLGLSWFAQVVKVGLLFGLVLFGCAVIVEGVSAQTPVLDHHFCDASDPYSPLTMVGTFVMLDTDYEFPPCDVSGSGSVGVASFDGELSYYFPVSEGDYLQVQIMCFAEGASMTELIFQVGSYSSSVYCYGDGVTDVSLSFGPFSANSNLGAFISAPAGTVVDYWGMSLYSATPTPGVTSTPTPTPTPGAGVPMVFHIFEGDVFCGQSMEDDGTIINTDAYIGTHPIGVPFTSERYDFEDRLDYTLCLVYDHFGDNPKSILYDVRVENNYPTMCTTSKVLVRHSNAINGNIAMEDMQSHCMEIPDTVNFAYVSGYDISYYPGQHEAGMGWYVSSRANTVRWDDAVYPVTWEYISVTIQATPSNVTPTPTPTPGTPTATPGTPTATATSTSTPQPTGTPQPTSTPGSYVPGDDVLVPDLPGLGGPSGGESVNIGIDLTSPDIATCMGSSSPCPFDVGFVSEPVASLVLFPGQAISGILPFIDNLPDLGVNINSLDFRFDVFCIKWDIYLYVWAGLSLLVYALKVLRNG